MEDRDLLLALAGVAATFIGFAGVVFAVDRSSHRGVTSPERTALLHLLLPWRQSSLLLLVVALAGCGATSSDSSPALIGQWGGTTVHVTASPSSLVYSLPCVQATFTGPIRLGAGGDFLVVGTISATSWGGWVGYKARVSGTIRGDTLEIGFERQDDQGRWPSRPAITSVVRGGSMDWPAGDGCIV